MNMLTAGHAGEDGDVGDDREVCHQTQVAQDQEGDEGGRAHRVTEQARSEAVGRGRGGG